MCAGIIIQYYDLLLSYKTEYVHFARHKSGMNTLSGYFKGYRFEICIQVKRGLRYHSYLQAS